MIFEGEFLNGERLKGKEYYYYCPDKIFEGEFLNGKRWNGKFREYYILGGLKTEGEYVNGEKKIKTIIK